MIADPARTRTRRRSREGNLLRKLRESDRASVLGYLSAEPAYNVFTVGDIVNFGFESPFQDVWADFDPAGGYLAVAMRYFDSYIVYSAGGAFDGDAVIGVLPRAGGNWMLSGKEGLVAEPASRIGLAPARPLFLAELRDADALAPEDGGSVFEWSTTTTFDEVIALQKGIQEFNEAGIPADAVRKNMESGTGRTVFARIDGRAVASASSAAEGPQAAMILGVCTDAGHRHRGLATPCVSRLCRVLLAEGKVACLHYDNPAAGRIYKRIGFRDVGKWATASGRRTPHG